MFFPQIKFILQKYTEVICGVFLDSGIGLESPRIFLTNYILTFLKGESLHKN